MLTHEITAYAGRYLLLAPLLLALAACGPSENATTGQQADTETGEPDVTVYDTGVFFDSVTYRLGHGGGHAFSSDGQRLLVNSDETGVFNAYALDLGNNQMQPLSDSDDNAVSAVSWFPDDDRVLLTGDIGGNEHNSVFVRELDGTLIDLLPPGDYEVAGQESGLRFESWQADGKAFFLTSTERDPQVADLYRYDADTYARKLVFQNSRDLPFPTRGFNVSPDGRWLALDFHHTRYDFDIYLVDLASDDRTPERILASEDGEVVYRGIGYTPDGSKFIYGTDANGEFLQAWTYELETGKTEQLIRTDWDVTSTRTNVESGVFFSPDGRYRITIENADARNKVTVIDTGRGEPVDLSFLPDGMISDPRFAPDGVRVAIQLERDTRPTDIYLVDLEDRTHRKLTEALNPEIRESDLVESEVVRFKSSDGLEIPGLLYRPRQASDTTPVPAMVWIHGGPGGQSRQGYNPVIQYLVNRGYAIYAINNRGSRGYGKTFRSLDRRRHGESDVLDVVASRGFLESFDWIDDNRIGVMGASYGGYLTLATITFHPDVFDAAISIVGFSDYIRNITEGGWRIPRLAAAYDEMGHPVENADMLRQKSPLFFADRISIPLFVAAGANDVRVPVEQNDRLVEAARSNGVHVEYLVFEDEGHGFRKRANRIRAVEAYVDFLERFLRAPGQVQD